MLLQRSPSTRKVETGVPWEGAEVLVKTEPDKFKIQVQVDHHENWTMLISFVVQNLKAYNESCRTSSERINRYYTHYIELTPFNKLVTFGDEATTS